ncbi:hypothetical protein BU16DRAFT_587201 [Lophium mytilinum]|uniref:Uncharacterized protein n=1 Tax=Lophium mytilinum TaxID=390894 RepID=A0A6A6RBS7_9PEZI|nr:hypothetical protein BU16DRAFT_587201 [Lophium mytilinum]
MTAPTTPFAATTPPSTSFLTAARLRIPWALGLGSVRAPKRKMALDHVVIENLYAYFYFVPAPLAHHSFAAATVTWEQHSPAPKELDADDMGERDVGPVLKHDDDAAIDKLLDRSQIEKNMGFDFVLRASAEEKMVQMGRMKMAVDHVVVGDLGADDLEEQRVGFVLKQRTAEFSRDDGTGWRGYCIRYHGRTWKSR